MIIATIACVVLSVLSASSIGTLSVWVDSIEDFSIALKDYVLPENAPEDKWKLVSQGLTAYFLDTYFYPQSSALEKLVADLTDKNSSLESWQHIKNWCVSRYSDRFSSIFENPKWPEYRELRRICVLPLSTVLDAQSSSFKRLKIHSGKIALERYESNLLISKMLHYKDWEEESKLKLEPELVSLFTMPADEREKQIRELASWCEESYTKGFKSDSDPLYVKVLKFCTLPPKNPYKDRSGPATTFVGLVGVKNMWSLPPSSFEN